VFFLESGDQQGVQRVKDRFGRPVLGIRDYQLIRGVPRSPDAQSAAIGTGTKPRPAMSLDEFFEQVRMVRDTSPLQGAAGLPGR
jgi:hypothetical protein